MYWDTLKKKGNLRRLLLLSIGAAFEWESNLLPEGCRCHTNPAKSLTIPAAFEDYASRMRERIKHLQGTTIKPGPSSESTELFFPRPALSLNTNMTFFILLRARAVFADRKKNVYQESRWIRRISSVFVLSAYGRRRPNKRMMRDYARKVTQHAHCFIVWPFDDRINFLAKLSEFKYRNDISWFKIIEPISYVKALGKIIRSENWTVWRTHIRCTLKQKLKHKFPFNLQFSEVQ